MNALFFCFAVPSQVQRVSISFISIALIIEQVLTYQQIMRLPSFNLLLRWKGYVPRVFLLL